MNEERPNMLTVRRGQPLIGVPDWEDGEEVTRYFADEAEAHAWFAGRQRRTALELAGAWSDLDWDETEAALDRIRHESRPTPPIELPDV